LTVHPLAGQRRSIARNTILNFGGLSLPLLVGVAVMPIITSNMGAVRFGLLGLTLALLEYSGLFDLGLGRATTKHVAEKLATGEDEISHLVIGSVLSQLAFGAVGGILFALAAPILATQVFVIPADMMAEAISVFRVLGALVPATLLLVSLRGVLEAAHRFDLSNAVRIPSSLTSFLIPAIASSNGYTLPAIMAMFFVARIFFCILSAIAVKRALPQLKFALPDDWSVLRPLLAFGGWMSVSNVVSPLLIYLDRFMLGAFVGLSAVGYYTAPFDGVVRMLIVPGSLVNALFPSVSAMHATGDRDGIKRVFSKAVRNMSLVLAVPALVLMLFGPMLLRFWLGETFAASGGTAVRILAFGVLMNSLAHVPSSFIVAIGRPDVNAKFHMLELLIHIPIAWWLIHKFGVTGAAIAWTIRVTFDAGLLFTALARLLDTPLWRLIMAKRRVPIAAVSTLADS
jgi:O-antigen/teichoic acid export membrane protein